MSGRRLDTTYLGSVNGGYGEELRCAAPAKAELHREDFTLNWRSMPARGIAVVRPTVQLELDVQAMYRTHDTPTPPDQVTMAERYLTPRLRIAQPLVARR